MSAGPDRSDACEWGGDGHSDCPFPLGCGCSCHQPTEADRLATYRAALAQGLSDAEAREEGWPAREYRDGGAE